jgi:hypothetical protein
VVYPILSGEELILFVMLLPIVEGAFVKIYPMELPAGIQVYAYLDRRVEIE